MTRLDLSLVPFEAFIGHSSNGEAMALNHAARFWCCVGFLVVRLSGVGSAKKPHSFEWGGLLIPWEGRVAYEAVSKP